MTHRLPCLFVVRSECFGRENNSVRAAIVMRKCALKNIVVHMKLSYRTKVLRLFFQEISTIYIILYYDHLVKQLVNATNKQTKLKEAVQSIFVTDDFFSICKGSVTLQFVLLLFICATKKQLSPQISL